jgi:hypothetical protein
MPAVLWTLACIWAHCQSQEGVAWPVSCREATKLIRNNCFLSPRPPPHLCVCFLSGEIPHSDLEQSFRGGWARGRDAGDANILVVIALGEALLMVSIGMHVSRGWSAVSDVSTAAARGWSSSSLWYFFESFRHSLHISLKNLCLFWSRVVYMVESEHLRPYLCWNLASDCGCFGRS